MAKIHLVAIQVYQDYLFIGNCDSKVELVVRTLFNIILLFRGMTEVSLNV